MNRLIAALLACLLAGSVPLLISTPGFAQEGSFDAAFGDGGRLLVDVSTLSTNDNVQKLVLRPGGKLLMAGTCAYPFTPDYNENTFCVTQLYGDGTYDGTFGPGGVGYLQFNHLAGWPANTDLIDMIVLADGRIALLGDMRDDSDNIEPNFLLAVLLADGSALDSTVGGGKGYLQGQQFGGRASVAGRIVQQPDGKILIVGAATGVNGNDDFAVARLLADFSGFDTQFGSGGSQTIAFDLGGPTGDNSDECDAVGLQSDGKIVLAGFSATTPPGQPIDPEISLVRLNTDGTRDLTFGPDGDGRLHYVPAGEAVALAADVQIDAGDRIVLAGAGLTTTSATSTEWVIDRLAPDGARDSAFNHGNAQIIYPPPGYAGYADRLALTNDGIFAIGVTPRALSGTSPTYFAVARLDWNGTLDARFGGGGLSYGSFTATRDVNTTGVGIAVSNGGLMVAGTQKQTSIDGKTSTYNFAIGRLQYEQIFSFGFE